MDRDNRRRRTAESSSHTGARLTDLPNDVISEVAKGLSPDNPHEAAINLAHFKMTSHAVQAELARGNAGQFEARLNRLGTLFATMNEKFLPEIPENTPEANNHFVRWQIPSMQPLLKFYDAGAQGAIVEAVMDNNNRWEKTVATAFLSSNLSDFHDPADRRRIIDQAITSFADDDPGVRRNGAVAVIRCNDHLNADDKARLAAMVEHTPELVPLYNEEKQRQQAWFRSQQAQPDTLGLDKSIDAIALRVDEVPPGIGSEEQATTVHSIASSITKTYTRARTEFMDIGRSRERSNSGR